MRTKHLIIPDQHIPYNDKKYWKTLMDFAVRSAWDSVIIMGDFMDFYSVSSYDKDSNRKYGVEDEIRIARKYISELEELNCNKFVFIEGNHEYRLTRYLNSQASVIKGLIGSVDRLLELDDKWTFIPYKQFYKLGKILFTHDVKKHGKNAINQTLDEVQDNIVIGHTHRLGCVYGGSVHGKSHVCMSVGWGGDYKKLDYMNKELAEKNWQHGFGIVIIDHKKNGYCYPVPIINNRVELIDGI